MQMQHPLKATHVELSGTLHTITYPIDCRQQIFFLSRVK